MKAKKEMKPQNKIRLGWVLLFGSALFFTFAIKITTGFFDWIGFVVSIPSEEWTIKLSWLINWFTIATIALDYCMIHLGFHYFRIGYNIRREGKDANNIITNCECDKFGLKNKGCAFCRATKK